MKHILAALVMGTCLSQPVVAADSNGDFAIRGAGRLSCEELLDAYAKMDQTRLAIFATWVEGYVTGQNQLQPTTFDALPWQTTELVMALARQACNQRGKDTVFMDVIGRLVAEMRPLRLPEQSEMIALNSGDAVQVHYRTTIERVRARLESLGYSFNQDNLIGSEAMAELTRIVTAYQQDKNLPVSGQLDQNTLLSLFVRPAE